MASDDFLARIDLLTRIDVLIDCLDAPDETGVIWRDDEPYDVAPDVPVWCATDVAEPEDDHAWILYAMLVSVGVGLLTSVVILLILAWSIYAAMGVILWLMVSSVS